MSTIEFPSISHSPEVMLQNIAKDHGAKLKNVIVVGFAEDGEDFIFTNSHDLQFLAMVQLVTQHMAMCAARGEVAEI